MLPGHSPPPPAPVSLSFSLPGHSLSPRHPLVPPLPADSSLPGHSRLCGAGGGQGSQGSQAARASGSGKVRAGRGMLVGKQIGWQVRLWLQCYHRGCSCGYGHIAAVPARRCSDVRLVVVLQSCFHNAPSLPAFSFYLCELVTACCVPATACYCLLLPVVYLTCLHCFCFCLQLPASCEPGPARTVWSAPHHPPGPPSALIQAKAGPGGRGGGGRGGAHEQEAEEGERGQG